MAPARRGIVVLIAFLFASAPGLALADEFADFRVPANRVLLWTGSATGSTSWGSAESARNHTKDGFGSTSLASNFYCSRESDTRLHSVIASVSARGDRSHSTRFAESPGSWSDASEAKRQAVDGQAALSLSERWYPEGRRVNVSAQVGASLADARRWATSRWLEVSVPSSSFYRDQADFTDEWNYSNLVSGTLGIGVGRARNVTGLYEALVFEQRLLAAGVLTRRLGPQSRRDLAALFYARSDYATSMERPAATVWAAIEGILARDGALATPGLEPRRLFEALVPFLGPSRNFSADGLPTSPVLRQHGWSARAIFIGSTRQYIRRVVSGYTSVASPGGTPYVTRSDLRGTSPSDVAAGGVAAEYHQPAGLRWQWDAFLTAQVPLRSGQRGLEVVSTATATFLVTDRWLAAASLQHHRYADQDASGFTRAESWGISPAASCEYWVNDHVDLNVQFSQGWGHDRTATNAYLPDYNLRRQQGHVSFGLGYRFAGLSEIPGITGPAH